MKEELWGLNPNSKDLIISLKPKHSVRSFESVFTIKQFIEIKPFLIKFDRKNWNHNSSQFFFQRKPSYEKQFLFVKGGDLNSSADKSFQLGLTENIADQSVFQEIPSTFAHHSIKLELGKNLNEISWIFPRRKQAATHFPNEYTENNHAISGSGLHSYSSYVYQSQKSCPFYNFHPNHDFKKRTSRNWNAFSRFISPRHQSPLQRK